MDTVSEEGAIANKKLNNLEKTIGFQPKKRFIQRKRLGLNYPNRFLFAFMPK